MSYLAERGIAALQAQHDLCHLDFTLAEHIGHVRRLVRPGNEAACSRHQTVDDAVQPAVVVYDRVTTRAGGQQVWQLVAPVAPQAATQARLARQRSASTW